MAGTSWTCASEEAIERLVAIAPVDLPAAYLDLLRRSDGCEVELPVQPFYFVLYDAEYVVEVAADVALNERLPGCFIFGSNGGGEYIAFDIRTGNADAIVFVDVIAGLESIERLTPSFEAFLAMTGQSASN